MAMSRGEREVEVAPSDLELRTERLGPLPIVNHYLGRLGLAALVEKFIPARDRSTGLPAAKGLGVLLRSVLVERQPVYQQGETVRGFAASCFGLEAEELDRVGDDALGRGLDRLFDADRASLLTEVVVAAARRFELHFEELHNDSTSVKLTGQYRAARGRRLRGKRAPWITYGFSKDHRPDLKQLLFILTTTADGGVPVQFRCADGNASDARTHIETWEELRRGTGRADFLYVADCKLCTRDNMDYIDRQGGRFVTVMPRSRNEDEEFRRWIQTNEPAWEVVRSRPNPRRESGPRDVWRVFRSPLPTREAFPMFWVWSTLLALNQEQSRRERLTRAFQDLAELRGRLAGPRPRLRSVAEVDRLAREILREQEVDRYVEINSRQVEEHDYRQEHPGRPRPETLYHRRTRYRVALDWTLVDAMVAFDRKSDGMYPLITNDRNLTGAQVLEAHKGQPRIEKRFSQLKCVHEIAPVFLKNEGRIEALFFLYFLGLLTQGLIERELRLSMKREGIETLPLYPEERLCSHPTVEQVFRLFAHAEKHVLFANGALVRTFSPQLTDLQRQVLALLRVPKEAYAV